MANVQVIQRNAHLAGSVKLEFVTGRDGKTAKAVLTAISNTRRGRGDVEDGAERRTEEKRIEEATVLQWTLWGKQAENAAAYLGKGSHVNIVGRLKNNNYKAGEDIYGWAFTVEEIDYLDTRAVAITITVMTNSPSVHPRRRALRLIPRWKHALRSGSHHVGQCCRAHSA